MASSPQVTYQRGHRTLFAAARRVLSPHQVEGASLSSSAQAVREGKQPMIEDQVVHEAHDDFIDRDARSSPSNFYEIIR